MATTSSSIDAADTRAVGSGAAAGTFDRVLLAVDDDTDDRVRDVAVSLAAAHGAELDALSVVRMDASVDHWDMVVERREEEAETALDAVGDAGRKADVPVHKRLRYGTPSAEIGLYADGNDVDLVVVPEPDRSGLKRLFSPSNLASNVRDATAVPVVSVPTNE
ncbi:universal stress protein [Halobaculum sp. WSA2]|uniref:Universal stress protein n=1 Tax=Halobaculum saliterrae TaxID=2073113 RepID=A0A6B0SRX0_9EURY|nr:universal stress protein [Halobaculum saliterrae]MXR41277.1 universal stress protein [Halobaculum saliterrae]